MKARFAPVLFVIGLFISCLPMMALADMRAADSAVQEISKAEKSARTSPGFTADDKDCVRGGCNGEICQTRDTPPLAGTCQWLPEYLCYAQHGVCVRAGKNCVWQRSQDLADCLKETKQSKTSPFKEVIPPH